MDETPHEGEQGPSVPGGIIEQGNLWVSGYCSLHDLWKVVL
jgi:hypothetical protein